MPPHKGAECRVSGVRSLECVAESRGLKENERCGENLGSPENVVSNDLSRDTSGGSDVPIISKLIGA
jgi:hypothetical protein